MHKKLTAALTIAIFALSSVAIFTPASAHFTLGDYTANFDYHANDFDPHLAGPTGYVWPGSGLASFTGTPAGFPAGYQSPWPGNNPPGQPSSNYQLEGNAYAPFGAILTSTEDHQNRGPLIFAFNFSQPCNGAQGSSFPGVIECDTGTGQVTGGTLLNFTGLSIYIPPEFDLSSAESNPGLIHATFATTANDFYLTRTDANNPIGPGWWVITFQGDIHFWPQHSYQEWFYVKINDVVAPTIAGKYFFKMFLWDMNSNSLNYEMNVPGAWTVDSAMAGGTVFIPTGLPTPLTFPIENWPVLLVKGEVDPGIVTGTIRYGTFNQTLYGHPINFPGMVDMVGTAIDPYLPDHPSTGRAVEARGYFNASAAGHYEVEGVAPGVYTIYAQAAGYPTMKIAENVVILPGQSFHLDGYLNPGPVVHGQIFSKHLFGEEAWPVNPRPMSVVLFSSNDYAAESIVAWSPWNKTHPGYMAYDWGAGYSVPEPLPVAYPWDTVTAGPPITPFGYYLQTFTTPTAQPALYNSHPTVTCGGNADPCGKPDGVGPAQYWWVDSAGTFTNGGGPFSFIFKFGWKGTFGAPTEIDGHVPQVYATWINGLTPGRYFVRAYLNGYVQTLQDGVTLDEYSFEVSQNEWAGDVFLPMDLRVSSFINKTVHFHDLPGTLDVCPINGEAPGCTVAHGQARGDRYMIAELYDQDNNLMGMNFTWVEQGNSSYNIVVNGFGMMGPDFNSHYFDDGPGMKFSYYEYSGHRDYGLPSGTYTIRIYMRGYVMQTFESVSVTLSGSPALISNHLYRGARFNITVYSIDWEHPRVQRPWEFPGATLRVYVYKDTTSYLHVSSRAQPAGLDGSLIGGSCNLNTDPVGEIADHCKIIEWDGYRLSNTFDTMPDRFMVGTLAAPGEYLFIGYGAFDPFNGMDGFLWNPGSYIRRSDLSQINALETGTYYFYGFTYGYLQHKVYSVYVMKGGFADIKLNLLQGVNITVNVPFKKEGIYSPTEFNMSMRVRVFDDQGNLIGHMQSGYADSATYDNGNPLGIGRWNGAFSNTGSLTYYVDPFASSPSSKANTLQSVDSGPATADGFLWFGTWNGVTGWQAFDSDLNGDGIPDFYYFNPQFGPYHGWIPAGTQQVRLFIAGVYDWTSDPLGPNFAGVFRERVFPGDGNARPYGIPGSSSTIPDGIPVSYSGKYYVEVDTWNEYPTPTFTGGAPDASNWYPPVEGLLQGDSFHTIPGASPNVFGYTGDTLAANGLGPYAQRMVWEIPNGHLGSEVSVVYELDKRGFISGNIYGFTWSDELRTVSWANVVFTSAAGNLTFDGTYSWDAYYGGYLDAGQYNAAVIVWSPSGQGYTVVQAPITISSGQSTTGVTFQLERSNIPVPEFSGLAIVAFSALAASLYLLRRKRR